MRSDNMINQKGTEYSAYSAKAQQSPLITIETYPLLQGSSSSSRNICTRRSKSNSH